MKVFCPPITEHAPLTSPSPQSIALLLILGRTLLRSSLPGPSLALTIVDPQRPARNLFAAQLGHGRLGALHVGEIGVGEPPRLARSSVNRHAHVDDVADFAEEVVELLIGHVEGHVADEEGAGGVVEGAGSKVAGDEGLTRGGVLDCEDAAFEGLAVKGVDGVGGGFLGGEVYVAETVGRGVWLTNRMELSR